MYNNTVKEVVETVGIDIAADFASPSNFMRNLRHKRSKLFPKVPILPENIIEFNEEARRRRTSYYS